jgi:hypothetical protein
MMKTEFNVHKAKFDELVKSLKFPPPSRGRVRVGAISDCISGCSFPLPLIPSRKGRGKCTFDEFIKFHVHKICRYGVTGQGLGMPCPCENMVARHVDIEWKNSIS